MYRIGCVSGTTRPGNYTSRALGVVSAELAALGHAPEVIDARNLKLSFPGEAPTDDHGCFSAMTKLTIENLGFPSVLAGKPVALVGVAAGRIGAIKSLEQRRDVLYGIHRELRLSVVRS